MPTFGFASWLGPVYRIALALAATLLLAYGITVGAADPALKLVVAGQTVVVEPPARIVEGRTLVPLRFVLEALGAEVAWDGATQTVTVRRGSDLVRLTIGDSMAAVNSSTLKLDVPPRLIENRTFVPLRFLAEVMGMQVTWLEASRTIRIDPPPAAATGSTDRPWIGVRSFAYQLQNNDLEAMGRAAFDLYIMDYSRDGSNETRFSRADIQRLKQRPGKPRLILAYMSIGEAESYRWYWQPEWDTNRDGEPDPGAPAWLERANPDWPNNYKVRYWDPDWQGILFGTPDGYLDKIIAAGFDGVYLDIIDAFEYFGPEGTGELDDELAQRRMVDLVRAMASYARETQGEHGFGIFPQNGSGLAAHPDYVEAVTGIGAEDTWYNDNTQQTGNHTEWVLQHLDTFRKAGKLVLVTDYVTRPALISDFYARAGARGFIPYATVRDLDVLTVNPEFKP